MRKTLPLALLAVALGAGTASAQWGQGASLFTQDGVEISVDARVFSVFALLNALGYERETIVGPAPLEQPRFSEARKSLRNRLGRPGSAVDRFGKVVAKHEAPPAAYVAAALQMGSAPRFDAPKQHPLAAALAEPVSAWFNKDGGAAIYREVAGELGAQQKALLGPIDALGQKLRGAARLGSEEDQLLEADGGPDGRVVVVVNALDAHGALQRQQVGDIQYVITGPQADADGLRLVTHAAGLAFARTLVGSDAKAAAKGATLAADVLALLPKERKAQAGNAGDVAAELVACGLLRAVEKGARCATSPLLPANGMDRVLTELDKRVADYLAGDQLLAAAMPGLLQPMPAPEPAAEQAAVKPKK